MNLQVAHLARFSGLSRGIVTQVLDGARVSIEPQSGGSIACDLLDMGLGAAAIEVGDRVVFSPYADGLGGCVIGRLNEPSQRQGTSSQRTLRYETLRISVDELILDARTRVELGTKRARLIITEDGRVQITADKLLAKARKVQRFLAPILRLN